MPTHRFTLYGDTTYIIPRPTPAKTTRLPKETKVYFNPFFITFYLLVVFRGTKIVKKGEQDLIPVLDVEEKGIQGRWKGRQLQDSIQVFADLVKKHYGKYPIIYSNESFYNKEMGAKFNRYYLFIANYNSRQPAIDGRGKCNIWQYSETGHLHGIGERVDLSRFMNGTTIKDLML